MPIPCTQKSYFFFNFSALLGSKENRYLQTRQPASFANATAECKENIVIPSESDLLTEFSHIGIPRDGMWIGMKKKSNFVTVVKNICTAPIDPSRIIDNITSPFNDTFFETFSRTNVWTLRLCHDLCISVRKIGKYINLVDQPCGRRLRVLCNLNGELSWIETIKNGKLAACRGLCCWQIVSEFNFLTSSILFQSFTL